MKINITLMPKGQNTNKAKVSVEPSTTVKEFFEQLKKTLQLKENTSIDYIERAGGERVMESFDYEKTLRDCDVDAGCTLYYVLKQE